MAEYAARAGVTESAKMPEIPQSLIEIVQRLIEDREGARPGAGEETVAHSRLIGRTTPSA